MKRIAVALLVLWTGLCVWVLWWMVQPLVSENVFHVPGGPFLYPTGVGALTVLALMFVGWYIFSFWADCREARK